ncbi:hypothetical protein SteCoe_14390 [Stentor coeruleus]|uniref:Polyadenylate-binding protein n=1 Tax=Stentor coeruleus TaxID=5963 RepID=A0A1R2C6A0_9CILI|nr:hypothetical protein SteCoe_15306 [Stentor coeruleus]OMJ84501.1 hypothetical protein SteCoe_14390 [Stentor coeruleus]
MADSTRILVTGLKISTTEAAVLQEFKKFGEIQYIRLKKSKHSFSCVISFSHADSAYSSRIQYNGKIVLGSRINVVLNSCFPIKDYSTNIFIKNIPPQMDTAELEEHFKCFGHIVNSKIVYDINGNSLGYGFLMFSCKEAAEKALDKVSGINAGGIWLEIKAFVPKHYRKIEFTNLYVRGFDDGFTQEDLVKEFSVFGNVVSSIVCHKNGVHFGFVSFSSGESVNLAIKELHGKKHSRGFEWFLSLNISRNERLIGHKIKNRINEENWQKTNLYIKNWPIELQEDQLRSVFSRYGKIDSVKMLMQDCLTLYYNHPVSEKRLTGQVFISFYEEKSVEAVLRAMKHTLINGTLLKIYRWVPKGSFHKGIYKPKQYKTNIPSQVQIQKPSNDAVMYFNFEKFRNSKPEDRKRIFGEAIYQEIFKKYDKLTGKITGMIIELDEYELLSMMENKKILYQKAKEAMKILGAHMNEV